MSLILLVDWKQPLAGNAYASSFFSQAQHFPRASVANEQLCSSRPISEMLLFLHKELCEDAIWSQLPKHRQTYHFLLYSPLLPVCHLVLLSREGHVYISLIFQKSLVGSTVLLQYENYQASYSVHVTTYSMQATSSSFPKSQTGMTCPSLFKH